jgi:uncharacterized protein (DUF1684 family)
LRLVTAELELTDWRRRTAELWRHGRDTLFRTHPQSPLLAEDPLRASGVDYWPYDPALRFRVPLLAAEREQELRVPTPGDGTILLHLTGQVALPDPVAMTLDVWWLHQYGGGIFIPLRDATAGTFSYGGGRYLLDTAKGADLGGDAESLVVDLNFAYHPSCRYNPAWVCPLAPPGNTTTVPVQGGEIMAAA